MKNKKKTFSLRDIGWLYSNNQLFLENIYKKFLSNSKKIDSSWKKIFKKISYNKCITSNNNIFTTIKSQAQEHKSHSCFNIASKNLINEYSHELLKEKFLNLINSYRIYGHYISNLNPLARLKKIKNVPELSCLFHRITPKELNNKINFNFLCFKKNVNSFNEIYLFFKKKYCSYIGFEYMHLNDIKQKKWLQNYIETKNIKHSLSSSEKKEVLKDLIQSTTFEKFIHTKFPGNKRFSLEGCDILIPVLKKIIMFCIKKKTKKIFLGMAHRGRLNVMYNVLHHNVLKMFNNKTRSYKNRNGTGDVKYHIGLKKIIQKNNKNIEINLLDNPSHLEIITPIVIGCCKFFVEQKSSQYNPLPIIIHGDAAFIGQGVIQETLNMSQVPAYNVLGSVHIIINNQIAFTTSKKKYLRTSFYCTDIAKMINAPIFHVNADQPESVMFIIKLALKFRYLFKKDVFIELVCYRRLGHNEVDDPYITQPKMYNIIKNHKRICVLYSKKIKNTLKETDTSYKKLYIHFMQQLYKKIQEHNLKTNNLKKSYRHKHSKKYLIKQIYNNVDVLNKIATELFTLPKHLTIHNQVKKIFFNRIKMVNNKLPLDWGAAENLVYAVLMYYGITCRLTGEDVRRGTFCHRHASIICQKKNTTYIPLQNLSFTSGLFYIWDSVLSEESTLAFEYGYSKVSHATLNVWEAQFGDFSNGAQVVIDQFITSSLQKWGYSSPLVILLPHGYEGQGPEHSSGRLERYLQLCAQNNIKIYIPTTVSQMYHILLKQGCSTSKIPIIIFTPKSLLRNPETFIFMKELLIEKFHTILLTQSSCTYNLISCIIFCSGKIYYELLDFYQKNNIIDTVIIRIEQLYPFPYSKINKTISKFSQVKNFIWCQEEPINQGSWKYIYFYFKKYILINYKLISLKYVGRPKFSSTAEGNFISHNIQQKKIIKSAFSMSIKIKNK
ncbi:2-oxoglutarate dehydrogenase E1 component [Buchnera aphidicola (Cinara pseudotaxifoliae)]|uniref:oxoglutarate dehydrogenase (succinyl-transferring) n=1 Tax=Buchnera aphidicola (Cinara pseudotaxifoliae) TaxID=655384 RepID=A0A451DH03_9GAMM|nr:2-oxoglutarate dehydrogenase E1 component [Buchnera aphidicola]VFP85904.1 2-oxoglutarate dehydrogenase E1 component [Buchnera aphidicola (Cinara pseudotaxifoliae)]